MKIKPSKYPIHASPFYKLQSKSKLAAILKTTLPNLISIIKSKNIAGSYKEWPTEAKYPLSSHPALAHKPRNIQQPIGELRSIQDRMQTLLSRIELPDYLHSARKYRSYRTNAAAHLTPGAAFRIDIKKFYESASDIYIQDFYRNVMLCSPDVSHLLTEIVCFRRRLPTGSPISPIMSFLAYAKMFDKINLLAIERKSTMTIYVDDIFLSGDGVTGEMVNDVSKILREYSLIGHKVAYFKPEKIRVITGITVAKNCLGITNKRKRKIRALIQELRSSTDPVIRAPYKSSLVGLLRESSNFDSHYKVFANAVERWK